MARFRLDVEDDPWKVIMADTHMTVDNPRAHYAAMAGVSEEDTSVEEALTDASFEIRRGFHRREMQEGRETGTHKPFCHVYAMRWQDRAGVLFPSLAKDISYDQQADRRMFLALVHKGCPDAARCMQYLLEEASLYDRPAAEYRGAAGVKKDALRMMKLLSYPFNEPAEEAVRNVELMGLRPAVSSY